MIEKIQFLKSIFSKYKIDRNEENIAIPCPKCKSSKLKLSIHIASGKSHCWVCGFKTGSIKKVLTLTGNSSKNIYAKKVYNKKDSTTSEDAEEASLELPDNLVPIFSKSKIRDPDFKAVIKYLASRGLSGKDMTRYRVMTGRTGKFKRTVFFPSFDAVGDLNFYVARTIDEGAFRKYINANVKKKEIIFNEIDVDWASELILVEGVFDAIKVNKNVVPLLGSDMSASHKLFKMIVRNKTPVTLCLDPDAILKQNKIARMLTSYQIKVQTVNITGYEDVGSMTKKQFAEIYNKRKDWVNSDLLFSKINQIRSGSLI